MRAWDRDRRPSVMRPPRAGLDGHGGRVEEPTVLDAQLSDARNAESDGGAVSRLQRLTPRRQRLTVVPVARVEVRNQRLVDPRVHLV